MDALEYFKVGLAELERQRDEIESRIEIARRLIAEMECPKLQPHGASFLRSVLSLGGDRSSVSIRQGALDLADRVAVFTLEEAVADLNERGNLASAASVSSVLSRLKSEGLLVSPGRGRYAKAGLAAASAQAHDATATTHEAPSLEEGAS